MKRPNVIAAKLKLLFIPCAENKFRPQFLDGKFLIYYLIFLAILKLIGLSSILYLPKTIFFADISSYSLVELTNRGREELALKPLKENPNLTEAAYLKAEDMFARGYFGHQSPEGKSTWFWIKEAAYDYQYAGENLAIGFLDAKEIYQAWVESPSHKANLFSPYYQDIGVAVLKGNFQGNETFVVVEMFASPRKAQLPAKSPAISAATEKPAPVAPPLETPIVEPEGAEKELAAKPEAPVIRGVTTFAGAGKTDNSFWPKFLRFLATDYDVFSQKIIFWSLIFVIICLLINIFIRFDIQYRDLLIRTSTFLLILALFNFVDKETIISVIPHRLLIC